MFTPDNTSGYSDKELSALNAELYTILAEIDPDKVETVEEAKKTFYDQVSRR